MMAVDGPDAFSGAAREEAGRVRDAVMVSRVACSGSRGMDNGDAVPDDAADRTSESKLSAVS